MDTMPDGVIGVLPVLRTREFDWYAAFREWTEAGKPDPTPEQVEAQWKHDRAEEPIWADGTQPIRPPAKSLTVSTETPPYSQE